MISPEKLFENYFDEIAITPTRLFNFGEDSLNRLTSANKGGEYTVIITELTNALAPLGAELGEVDVALAIQKGTTLTNDQVLTEFKKTMSQEEPFIARALGGKGTAAYLQFYPKGVSEYANTIKTTMPTLTNRINAAATANAAALGAPLTATLQSFEEAWKKSRDTQQQQIGTTSDNRADRTQARATAELTLVSAVHLIASKFPGDVQQCNSFFNFNLLFAQTRRKHQTFANPLKPLQTITVFNRTLTDTFRLNIRNTDDNAAFVIWLSATPDAAPPATALEVQPGRSADVKPSALGDLAQPFLLIKNLSDVNDGAYEVEVR